MIKIDFLKPFSFIEEGAYIDSIVAYGKIPIEFENVDVGNGYGKTIVTKYRCKLIINLWLIIINFNWIKNI